MNSEMFGKVKVERIKDLLFLCNYQNGAVIYLEEQYREEIDKCIKTKSMDSLSDDTKEYLEECGFFDLIDEVNGQVYVHVTDRCNMDCIGCYSRTSLRNVRKDMDLEDIKNIFNQLKNHKVRRIIISGGEPMLRKDIGEIINYGKKIGFEVAMISNGSFLIPSQIMKNLDYLSFSVDVLDNNKNQLNRIIHKDNLIENINIAKELGICINGIVTINAGNVDFMDKYFEMSKKYSLPITFSIFHSTEDASKPFLLKDIQLRKMVDNCIGALDEVIEGFSSVNDIFCRENCGVGKSNISIDASGNLSPCHMLHSVNMGNLLENSDSTWKMMESFCESLCTPNECEKCDYFIFCGGGCKARALLTGNGKGKDPYCTMYKHYYETQYKYIKSVI